MTPDTDDQIEKDTEDDRLELDEEDEYWIGFDDEQDDDET